MIMLQAVLLWHVYQLTGSYAALGFIGLARLFPALAMSMIGGTVADIYNRRYVALAAQTVSISTSITLAVATFGGWISIEMIYVLVIVLAVTSSFESPAAVAMLPGIVRPETYSHAVVVSSTFQSLGRMVGPGIAGQIIGFVGVGEAYLAHTTLIAVSFLSILLIKYRRAESRRFPVNFKTVTEGVVFVKNRQVLLGAMSLDMFAVIFGGAQALLPAYAEDILEVGPTGYGILASSIEAGAFLTAAVMVVRPPINRTGVALLLSVAAYGVFTMIFGLSRSFGLSIVLYGLIGAADQVSMVMRQTTIQMATPDELRGRVSAVHQVFVGASNHLGAIESGFVAALTSATFAVVSGGFGTLLVVAFIALRLPALRDYRLSESVMAVRRGEGTAAPLGAGPDP
jgi:MFS family permease